MAETGWQAIGRIAKARRERLGLNQDELALYGGPRVATVGKFERAAQASFPLRTQHQMEKALGWSRGIVEQVVESIDKGELTAADWEHDLVVEDVPDMSRRPRTDPEEDELAESLDAIRSVLKIVDPERRDDAVRAAVRAMLPALSPQGATELGRGLRRDFPPQPATPAIYDELLVDEAAFDPEKDDRK